MVRHGTLWGYGSILGLTSSWNTNHSTSACFPPQVRMQMAWDLRRWHRLGRIWSPFLCCWGLYSRLRKTSLVLAQFLWREALLLWQSMLFRERKSRFRKSKLRIEFLVQSSDHLWSLKLRLATLFIMSNLVDGKWLFFQASLISINN